MGKRHDLFDDLLLNYSKLLPQFRDRFGRSNCPLTAQAVWKYFNTGKIEPAPPLLGGAFKMVECDDSLEMALEDIVSLLREGGHGTHGVVSVNSGEKDEHNFNVVNIRGTVYLVDAYNPVGLVTPNLRDHLGYARRLEFSFGWNMRIVPTDAIGKYRCPPPPPPNNASKQKRAKKKQPSQPIPASRH